MHFMMFDSLLLKKRVEGRVFLSSLMASFFFSCHPDKLGFSFVLEERCEVSFFKNNG